ncbi:(2Fe-2S) ferredoxin domain-containing protein [Actinoplanes sp. NPDC023936]|uniref:(2Fe-2S) ferredoxin domain-containing protein n=1 Tax=Actinoplanes sp. NPDC023936 TaxID=3154910 RepID=UPI0033DCBDFF
MPEQVTPCTAKVTVLLCCGHRCAALGHRTDTGVGAGEAATLLGVLREAVRRTRNAVLVRSECLGACTVAPAVAVISGVPAGAGRLFGPVESPAQVSRLLESVARADRDG